MAKRHSDPTDGGRPRADRRTVLKLVGAGAGAIATAGCLGDGSTDDEPDPTRTFGYGGKPAAEPRAQDVAAAREAAIRRNDDRGGAIPIPTGERVTAWLDPGDVDWYVVGTDEKAAARVTYSRTKSRGVTAIVAYNAGGQLHDFAYVGSDDPVRLRGTGGETYLQVLDVEGGNGPYALFVGSEADGGPDRETENPTTTDGTPGGSTTTETSTGSTTTSASTTAGSTSSTTTTADTTTATTTSTAPATSTTATTSGTSGSVDAEDYGVQAYGDHGYGGTTA